jgi:hypothetical protein
MLHASSLAHHTGRRAYASTDACSYWYYCTPYSQASLPHSELLHTELGSVVCEACSCNLSAFTGSIGLHTGTTDRVLKYPSLRQDAISWTLPGVPSPVDRETNREPFPSTIVSIRAPLLTTLPNPPSRGSAVQSPD